MCHHHTGAGVDDVPGFAAGEHARHKRADAVDDPPQVHSQDPFPVDQAMENQQMATFLGRRTGKT